jgi:hypothetical protein
LTSDWPATLDGPGVLVVPQLRVRSSSVEVAGVARCGSFAVPALSRGAIAAAEDFDDSARQPLELVAGRAPVERALDDRTRWRHRGERIEHADSASSELPAFFELVTPSVIIRASLTVSFARR